MHNFGVDNMGLNKQLFELSNAFYKMMRIRNHMIDSKTKRQRMASDYFPTNSSSTVSTYTATN